MRRELLLVRKRPLLGLSCLIEGKRLAIILKPERGVSLWKLVNSKKKRDG